MIFLKQHVRYFYSLILYLMMPSVIVRQWWRGRSDPLQRGQQQQRLGFDRLRIAPGCIWLHAVSVGEVVAAEPLIRELLRQSDREILVTTTTASGKTLLHQRFGDQLQHRYLPWDLPGSVRRFLGALQPSLALFMETELWPNLYHQLQEREVPLYLVNARLSTKSLAGYRRFESLTRQTLAAIYRIAARSDDDAHRYLALGVEIARVSVTGNLKYEARLPDDFELRVKSLQKRFGGGRKLWVAGSTHPGEEDQVLRAHRVVLQRHLDALLILVPRHPERASEVRLQCRQAGIRSEYFSKQSGGSPTPSCQAIIVDQLGVLSSMYAIANVAFIGGSLVDQGGHNPIEAALAGTPVISGCFRDNFSDVYAQFEAAGAARFVNNERQLGETVCLFMNDDNPGAEMVKTARQLVEQNRGALKNTLQLLKNHL